MAKAMVETLVDDLDGSPAVETVRLGWNGDWRELDLSKRNAAALSRALDRFWTAARPVVDGGPATRRRRSARSRSKMTDRDPKAIRAWALTNGIEVPSRGRIPAEVERQYNDAAATS
jgi:Lsr2